MLPWTFHWHLGSCFLDRNMNKQTKQTNEQKQKNRQKPHNNKTPPNQTKQTKGARGRTAVCLFSIWTSLSPPEWCIIWLCCPVALCEKIPVSPAKTILSKNHPSTWLWQENRRERRLYLVKAVSARWAKMWPQRINNRPDWLNPHGLLIEEEALGPRGFSIVTDGMWIISFPRQGASQQKSWNPLRLEPVPCVGRNLPGQLQAEPVAFGWDPAPPGSVSRCRGLLGRASARNQLRPSERCWGTESAVVQGSSGVDVFALVPAVNCILSFFFSV